MGTSSAPMYVTPNFANDKISTVHLYPHMEYYMLYINDVLTIRKHQLDTDNLQACTHFNTMIDIVWKMEWEESLIPKAFNVVDLIIIITPDCTIDTSLFKCALNQ